MKAPTKTAIAVALALFVGAARAQSPSPGLRLYQEYRATDTVLVDSNHNVAHTWPGTRPAMCVHLMPDGSLIRTVLTGQPLPNGVAGGIERVAFDGTLLWDLPFDSAFAVAHHDVCPMPNGNLLVIAWDRLAPAAAIARGRDPALVSGTDFLPDAIYEMQQTGPRTGAVVWSWHVWDHLIQDFDPTRQGFGVVAAHPELIDINFPRDVLPDGDFNHCNGIDYDPIHDLIVISARSQSEVWIIDHATTTREAAMHTGGRRGRGGDLLWRWGNPAAYQHGTSVDQQLFGQHDPRWILPGRPGAGNLTIFNNGVPVQQSSVVELQLPQRPDGSFPRVGNGTHGPAAPVWTWSHPYFDSVIMSSAERLPNGNTLICGAVDHDIGEITAAGALAWYYQVPQIGTAPTLVFQADYVERTLWTDTPTLSATSGGALVFEHAVGSAAAPGLRFSLLLGSTLGTAPGQQLLSVHVPLNPDLLFFNLLSSPNRGPFTDTFDVLDQAGRNTSRIDFAPRVIPPDMVGLEVDFAHLLFDERFTPLEASNTVHVRVVR